MYCGRFHKEGREFPLYLVDNLVVISPIDRADVTSHTIALVKVLNNIILAKLLCSKLGMAETRCVSGGDPGV
jgi:hypothetical protein